MNYNWGTTLGFVIMNWDSYNKLPADLQQLLDESWEPLSYALAEEFNGIMQELFSEVMPEYGVTIYDPSDEVLEGLNQKVAELIETPWIEAVDATGADGKAMLQLIRDYITEGYEVYGEEFNWIR